MLKRVKHNKWTEGDSNSQPLQCECSALPIELSAQKLFLVLLVRIELASSAPEADALSIKLQEQKF